MLLRVIVMMIISGSGRDISVILIHNQRADGHRKGPEMFSRTPACLSNDKIMPKIIESHKSDYVRRKF